MRVVARLVGARVGHDACEKYGIEHKNPAGLTPLMLAALAGNARLVRALLDRGASRTARDAFGRTAMHYVLFPLMAKGEQDPVMIELADAYAALVLDAVDLRVDGRLVRLYPHQAEFVHLAVVTTHYASMFRWLGQIELVSRAFFVNPKVPSALGLLDCLPGSIVPAYRLAPTYVNAALAKNERDAAAKPNRKLWRRIRHGEYLPNPEIAVRYGAVRFLGSSCRLKSCSGSRFCWSICPRRGGRACGRNRAECRKPTREPKTTTLIASGRGRPPSPSARRTTVSFGSVRCWWEGESA